MIKYVALLVGLSAIASTPAKKTGEELKAYLDGKTFITDMRFFVWLEFKAGKYELAHRQGLEANGTYSVRGGKIYLGESQDATTCELDEQSKSPGFSVELRCGKQGTFYLKTSARPEGEVININGEPAIVVPQKMAEITTRVVFRKKPGKSAKALRCENGSSPLDTRMSLTVYARTKEKVKVDKWENYWYFLYNNYSPEGIYNPETGTAIGCEAPPGWVFGEFLKFRE